MTHRILNVALFGTGTWAQSVHIPIFQSLDYSRLLTICGQDENRTRKIANKFSIPKHTTSIETILKDQEIDYVSIATSSNRHFELALQAIRSGKSVLCEKPLASSVFEAKLLCDLARSSRVKTKMNFGFRFSRALRKMKKLVSTGFVGRPFHLNAFEQNSIYLTRKSVPYLTPNAKSSAAIAPGSLREYAPHIIDLAIWMTGDFKSVVGCMKNFVSKREKNYLNTEGTRAPLVEDGCVWLAEFANGSIGTMQSSFVAIGPKPGLEFRIYGSKGSLVARIPNENGEIESLKFARPDHPNWVPINISLKQRKAEGSGMKTVFRSPSQERFRLLVEDFTKDILMDRQKPECTFEDGFRVQEVVQAISLSNERRKWIDLPLEV